MKLRNKKTGEIAMVEFLADYQNDDGTEIGFRVKNTLDCYSYSSLAELNEDWEDYKPAEPLIKDEKIRKAVRAWAEVNNINSNHYYETNVKFSSPEHEFTWIDTSVQFNEITGLERLEDGKEYTIAELCGEEEE